MVLAALQWCRARSRRTEDAARGEEIEESIRLVTTRLYRIQELWQAHQLRAVSQQHDSCTETLQHGPMSVKMQESRELSHQQLQVHISSCNASDENAEVLLTPKTAAPSSFHLHHCRPPPPPPPIYQQHLQNASVTSSYQPGIAGGSDLLAKLKPDSLMSLSSARGLKATVPLSPLIRSTGIIPSLRSAASTRVFAGISNAAALRRSLRAPQLDMEPPAFPLLPPPTQHPSSSSSTLTTWSEFEESPFYQVISTFQFPVDLSGEPSGGTDESVLETSSVETLVVHYRGGGGAQSPRGTADDCAEEGMAAMARHTGVAAAYRHVDLHIHLEVDEPDETPMPQRCRYGCAGEKHRGLLPSPTPHSCPRRYFEGDAAFMSNSPAVEDSRVNLAAGNNSAALPATRTERRAHETVAAAVAEGGDSSLDASVFADDAELQGRFTPSRLKSARESGGSRLLLVSLHPTALQ
ncbi:hypothetical protein LDBPK_200410 [Leishmania donovani]|uniref:Uncharacterized protein n=1 Tax=Leishmania donovani TaxID=5661 RepID=E9BEI8_LEIDO|nr:hypothetical protein LDBPK_200410 [Leishmania donovani]AYU78320.1 hypothetical protein LdCL_200008800 [Leishmania donovani]CBZ33674.1 hypothetical protein LDBPK_200410 [Leishmania donovani]